MNENIGKEGEPYQFGKGVDPSKAGKKSGEVRREKKALRERLDNIAGGDALQKLLEAHFNEAMDGCRDSRKDLIDRIEGKPTQRTEVNAKVETKEQEADLSGLSDDALREMLAIAERDKQNVDSAGNKEGVGEAESD